MLNGLGELCHSGLTVSQPGEQLAAGGTSQGGEGPGELVNELRLMVFPVLLGSGKRLFGPTSQKKELTLTSSTSVGDGAEILVYQPARAEEASATSSPA
jgi:hypothetical protein